MLFLKVFVELEDFNINSGKEGILTLTGIPYTSRKPEGQELENRIGT